MLLEQAGQMLRLIKQAPNGKDWATHRAFNIGNSNPENDVY